MIKSSLLKKGTRVIANIKQGNKNKIIKTNTFNQNKSEKKNR